MNTTYTLKIDSEFRDLIEPLTSDESQGLESNILKNGCLDPLKVWKGQNILLDGHNRYKICQKYNIPFQVIELEFATREDAFNWIIRNQLDRRNLTSEQISYLRGKRYLNEKKSHGGSEFNPNGRKGKEPSGKNYHSEKPKKTSQMVAEELKVSEKTVRNDGNFTESVDKIEKNLGKQAKSKILSRQTKVAKQDVKKLAEVAEVMPEIAEKIIETGNKEELRKAHSQVVKQKEIEKQQEKEIEQEKPAIEVAVKPTDDKVKSKTDDMKESVKQEPLFELKAPEPVKQGNETFTDEKGRVLHIIYSDNKQSKFNETNESIDWAWWSWNPITGCNHGCSYCYARDIATSSKMSAIYPFGFEPTFLPHRLIAPKNTKPFSPDMIRAKANQRNLPLEYAEQFAKNVFVCSMADLFGDWVPTDWIKQVFEQVSTYTQWNYLFLTKFPQRLKSIQDEVLGGKFPDNCWVGTTVDEQKRVKIAQKAFEGINAKVKWLSLEPLLTNLEFDNLGMFDMVAIGGQSGNSQCKPMQPEWEWVENIIYQAHLSKTMVYFKENLTIRPKKLPLN